MKLGFSGLADRLLLIRLTICSALNSSSTLSNASLELSFESAPAAGTAFTLLTADKIGGEFATVSAGEVDIELSYSDDKVVATVQ